MRTIKDTVNRLIKTCGTNDPFEIAAQKNVLVLFEPLGNILGYYTTYKRIPIIHINQDSDESEQRYTCGHELGHLFLHPKVNTPFLRKNTLFSIDRIEREANQFAVELLIPDYLIQEYRHTPMTLNEAASIYGVPQEMVNLKQLSQSPSRWGK
ncbi:ImmA/IrrE family metallo-endopeptidase [Brevibacillus centrosporus]|uniref:ImmA/IrrE family metallo-endopeptidase n=1 Tax=Brevibacillus centrosporus TaxID=54910 RepID=UPI000F0A7CB9|nr:ImmA/IrrE family metallo-endopeptidase [Brevibacillus centrosporus]MEC2133482.1 ImmA/IrrE family metallo-endopeptidase [Brevibacillus centrosporus]RNB64199.1 ImmA/IrrE family metallo-endopeptidase [Brevibacillus centrosporus]GED34999.1 ImmA/IrrE family metallo-endopeptidase [Brevibacillus centrosporus]